MQSSIAHTPQSQTRPAYVPPLDIARAQARHTLAEANALDMTTASSWAVAREFGGVCEALRHVLAALDAEDRRDA
ncbi:hypothetical protein [Streptomyces sp. NPDC045251]|uniref:hypothetical protein n=1 Tax=unclassified Streptomyces TaxID=2593676 RepID=UPI0033F219A2